MSCVDSDRLRRIIIDAVCDVIGAPKPDRPGDLLDRPIREILGGDVPAEYRKKVAKLIAKRINDRLEEVFDTEDARVVDYRWLLDNEDRPLSWFADLVDEELRKALGCDEADS